MMQRRGAGLLCAHTCRRMRCAARHCTGDTMVAAQDCTHAVVRREGHDIREGGCNVGKQRDEATGDLRLKV